MPTIPGNNPHYQTLAIGRPCIQPIDPFARRDRRPHEAHYRNLSQYERNDVEDNKRCNRGTQPNICGKYGGYRREVGHARYADRDTSNAGHPRGLAQHRVLNRLRQLLECGKPFDTSRRLLSAGRGGGAPRGRAPPYPAAHPPHNTARHHNRDHQSEYAHHNFDVGGKPRRRPTPIPSNTKRTIAPTIKLTPKPPAK